MPKNTSAKKTASGKKHVHYHKDGSIWATGALKGKFMHGYWEWFRKPGPNQTIGTIMRSGNFKNGKQVGDWTTYDTNGKIVKVTTFEK
jgi:antitoxin component YwqK of YwqJK toxin-antitoxin module